MPVWPPPSPPWAMTASTPISSTFSAWRRAPTVGITTHAGVVAAGDRVLGRRAGEAHEPHALGHDEGDPLGEVGLVGPEVHAEGRVGALLHRCDRGPQLLGRHGDGGEDAEAAGRARGGGQVGAGDPAHARLHDRVAAPDQVAEPGPQRRVDRI